MLILHFIAGNRYKTYRCICTPLQFLCLNIMIWIIFRHISFVSSAIVLIFDGYCDGYIDTSITLQGMGENTKIYILALSGMFGKCFTISRLSTVNNYNCDYI